MVGCFLQIQAKLSSILSKLCLLNLSLVSLILLKFKSSKHANMTPSVIYTIVEMPNIFLHASHISTVSKLMA
jgi:hypothetical protein